MKLEKKFQTGGQWTDVFPVIESVLYLKLHFTQIPVLELTIQAD